MSELGISSLCKPRGELQSEIANCVVKEHRAEKLKPKLTLIRSGYNN